MTDKAWKAFERAVAKQVGGVRRGPDYGGVHGGKSDIIHDKYSFECKLLKRVTIGACKEGCRQSERNAEPGKSPWFVVKKLGDSMEDALVMRRMPTWLLYEGAGVTSSAPTSPSTTELPDNDSSGETQP